MDGNEGDTREMWCLAIGGGEEKEDGRETLRRFLGLAGGNAAQVVLVELGEESVRGPMLASQLREAGAGSVHDVHAADGAALDDPGLEAAARGATGFYLLGSASGQGDLVKGSRFGREMMARAAAGAVVAASS
jgi:cyanophycinase-like exopeptidase